MKLILRRATRALLTIIPSVAVTADYPPPTGPYQAPEVTRSLASAARRTLEDPELGPAAARSSSTPSASAQAWDVGEGRAGRNPPRGRQTNAQVAPNTDPTTRPWTGSWSRQAVPQAY